MAVLAEAAGKKYLVLGDMGELGDGGADFHRMIGREARQASLSGLLTLGKLSAYATAEYGEGARHFESMQALLAEIESYWRQMSQCWSKVHALCGWKMSSSSLRFDYLMTKNMTYTQVLRQIDLLKKPYSLVGQLCY